MSCNIFSNRTGGRRDLHSFPTRRSSDLIVFGRIGDLVGRKYTFLVTILFMGGSTFAVRSEEHTSELQSLRHLVCRLLLEKKTWRADMQCPRWALSWSRSVHTFGTRQTRT